MLRTTLRTLAARKLRLALTGVAIMLGVAFVTGTYVLTDTSSRLFDEQFADVTDGVDLVVRSDAAFGAAMGVEVERDPIPDDALATIQGTAGVKSALPQIQGQALLFDTDGAAIVPDGTSVAMSWAAPPFGAFELREGHAPAADGDLVVDAATATDHAISVGDRIDAQGAAGTETFRVSGIAGFGDRDGMPNATVALFGYETAGELLDVPQGASQVLVVAEDSGTVEALRDTLSARLGDGYEISTSRDTAAASAAAAKSELAIVRIMLLAIAATALVVGAFLIANTFSITVTQRVRELAVVRAVGATGRQTLMSVLTEAVVVGAVASAVGALLGVASAYGLRNVVRAAGVDLPDGSLLVAPRTVILAMGVGVGVTVLSALAAARRASKIAPVQAMRHDDRPVHRMSTKRRILGGVTATTGIGLAVSTAVGVTPAIAAAGASVLAIIVALAVLAPAFAGQLAGFVGRPLRRAGVAGTLARGSAQRSPRRTAATTSALAIGLAVVSFMTVLGASVRMSTTTGFDEAISADLVIESARSEMLGGLSHHVHHDVSELEEVGAISKLRFGHWQQDGATKALAAIDPGTIADVATLRVADGSLERLDAGGVAITDTTAAAEGLSVGDTLSMTFARTGDVDMPVVAIFDQADQWAVSTSYLISLPTYSEHFTEDVDAVVYVSAASGVSVPELRAAVDSVLVDYPTAIVRDEAEARESRTDAIDRILAMVTVLLLFTVLIALLGITNTLALSIIERTREIGLLRAVGMTRRQVRSMIRWEALLDAVLGATLGLVLGIGFGWVAVRALSADSAISMVVPAGRLGAYLVTVAVAGVLAGLLPSRRAARLEVLESIATSKPTRDDMVKPAIVVLHDQPDELTRLLTRRFGADYRIAAADAGPQLIELVQEQRVAVVLAGREVGGESTLPLLADVRGRDPDVVRCLLSPIADRTTAQQLYKAVDAGSAERCLPAPWGHPDVGLYPQVSAMLSAWWCKTAPDTATAVQLTVVAPPDSSRLPEMRDLADRNNVTTRFLAPDTPEGRRILDRSGASATSVVVVAEGKPPLVDPAVPEIGGLVGARLRPEGSSCDVAVVGAGPSGLAAAVYAASEGLSTVVLEPRALGGQAGTSSAIRNYPGFPYGISGADLASRLAEQAWLLGAQTVYRAVTALRPGDDVHRLDLDGGSQLTARAVVLATGVRYRQLQVPGVDRLRGAGVFHGAARAEAPRCAGRRVHVVGGGNAAGQAAVHLAEHAATVTVLVRGDSLAATMSDYLVRQIQRTENILVRLRSSVAAAHGSTRLEALSIRTGQRTTTEDAAALFVLIGAEPDTAWLPAAVVRDRRGFVVTGTGVPPRARRSLPYETSVAGVFAIGDVRQGSTKRVAAAVGEGAVSVASVHIHLARAGGVRASG